MSSEVDLVGMNTPRNPFPKVDESNFEISQEVYLDIAKKLVSKLANGIRPGLSSDILASEDAISNIATEVMIADWRWNGYGTKFGYRKQRAIWAMQSFMHRQCQTNKRKTYSLDETIKYGSERIEETFADILESREESHESVIDHNEYLGHVTKRIKGVMKYLKPIEKKCIIKYYLEEKTLQIVANELGCTREWVRQVLISAKNLMKRKLKI